MNDTLKSFIARVDWMKTATGLTFLSVFAFQAVFLSFYPIPTGNESLFHTLFGMVDFGTAGLIGYYYGSSKGSQDKSKMIEKIQDKEIK